MPPGTDRFQSNSQNMAGDTCGIFLDFSRINHYCTPNVTRCWHEDREVLTIHALKAIKQGTELGTSYKMAYGPRDERREELKKWWSFDCECETCRASPNAVEALDRRRQQSREITDAIIARRYGFDRILDKVRSPVSLAFRMHRSAD
jgi:hypothetical protein